MDKNQNSLHVYLACIKKKKKLYQDIERHEKSKIHENSSLAVLRAVTCNDIGNLINLLNMQKKLKIVEKY